MCPPLPAAWSLNIYCVAFPLLQAFRLPHTMALVAYRLQTTTYHGLGSLPSPTALCSVPLLANTAPPTSAIPSLVSTWSSGAPALVPVDHLPPISFSSFPAGLPLLAPTQAGLILFVPALQDYVQQTTATPHVKPILSTQTSHKCQENTTIDVDSLPDTSIKENKWVCGLSKNEEHLLSTTNWLNDSLVNVGQQLIGKLYPRANGLQNTLLGQSMAFDVMRGEFVHCTLDIVIGLLYLPMVVN